jgi:hypothetical protein
MNKKGAGSNIVATWVVILLLCALIGFAFLFFVWKKVGGQFLS